MSLRADLVWKGSFGVNAKKRMGRALHDTCRDYFRRMDRVQKVTLFVLSPDAHRRVGSNPTISLAPSHLVDEKIYQGGVAVYVKCDANAQLCYLVVEGMTSAELRDLVSMGPISRQDAPKVIPLAEDGITATPLTQTDEPQVPPVDALPPDSQPENPGTRRVVDNSLELLRMFWETILADGIGQIEGRHLVLTNEILTARAVKDFALTPTQGEKVSFYRKCVAPFGEAVLVKGNKGWKLSVPALQEFLQGGSLSRKKSSIEPQRGVEDVSKDGREPDAVLNELEVLLKRIEVANQLQHEQFALQASCIAEVSVLKELDAQIAVTQRTLAELRGKREASNQILNKDNARLEEIKALLAQNDVSEETMQRLRKMGILKGGTDGESSVVRLVAQGGKS
jgi:hypothetical protein